MDLDSISGNDLQELLKILQKQSFVNDPASLRMVLRIAGFGWLVPQLNFNQAPQNLIFTIIERLCQYGQDEYGHEAIGRFLNSLIDGNYVTDSKDKLYIQSLVNKYNMMPAVSVSPDAPSARLAEPEGSEYLEKIIGENTLRPVAFLSRAVQVSNCVCYVGIPGGAGTGYLIGNNLLITNNHVIYDRNLLSQCIFRFNYQTGMDGKPQPLTDYKAKIDGIYHTNRELDYTVVELDDSPGTEWGHTKLLSNVNIKPKESRVNIIQHPGGMPKHVSIQNNFVEYMDEKVIQYLTSTLPGSSGSPVFDDTWQVVALHHSGGMITEPKTQRKYFRNEGILIPAIVASLPDGIKAAL